MKSSGKFHWKWTNDAAVIKITSFVVILLLFLNNKNSYIFNNIKNFLVKTWFPCSKKVFSSITTKKMKKMKKKFFSIFWAYMGSHPHPNEPCSSRIRRKFKIPLGEVNYICTSFHPRLSVLFYNKPSQLQGGVL